MRSLIFALILLVVNVHAQEVLIQYEYTKQKNLRDTAKVSQKFYLRIKGNESLFFSEAEYVTDSIFANADRIGEKINYRSLPADLIGAFIKKNNNGTITYYSNSFVENEFSYDEKLDLDWKIIGKNKLILGYNTTLAKTSYAGRDYEAYFSPEIPIQDGPYKFCGLPGLILEIKDTKNLHSFKIIGITQNNSTINIDLAERKFVHTTKQKFISAKRSYEESPMRKQLELIQSTGITQVKDRNGNNVDIKRLFAEKQMQLRKAFELKNNIE